MSRIITLLTDYGDRDYYVAAVKGAILSIAPHANIVDITHNIAPQKISDAAFVLRHTMSGFPTNTIHVAIVDPGVGSSRKILLAKYDEQYVIAPDNGLLTWIDHDFERDGIWSVENAGFFAAHVRATFHGRDIMGPVAGRLATGVAPSSFGPEVERIERLPIPLRAEIVGGGFVSQVIYVDRFGTFVTNLHESQLPRQSIDQCRVQINQQSIGPIRKSYHEVPHGELVAYIGSTGFLEVAVNCGSAIDRLGDRASIEVIVRTQST
ncbi:MAG: SAM-dependent chlorinase/fluorinase [Planctomycetes bacterium]|nr:SAM-dependent chlorinase/fluorinase [Planctomycetota bacterium]MBI3835868.1 SAM-dependent chlorinase/fluorinase [Planctomycetota bacterium]